MPSLFVIILALKRTLSNVGQACVLSVQPSDNTDEALVERKPRGPEAPFPALPAPHAIPSPGHHPEAGSRPFRAFPGISVPGSEPAEASRWVGFWEPGYVAGLACVTRLLYLAGLALTRSFPLPSPPWLSSRRASRERLLSTGPPEPRSQAGLLPFSKGPGAAGFPVPGPVLSCCRRYPGAWQSPPTPTPTPLQLVKVMETYERVYRTMCKAGQGPAELHRTGSVAGLLASEVSRF